MDANPTWLVTGANGFLGANVGAFLTGKANRVGAVRKPVDADGRFDRYVVGDLEDPTEIARTIQELKPDVVIHAAAMASHEACEADPERASLINAIATESIAQAAHQAGSKFVLISTDAVFDGARGHYRETDEPNSTSVYGQTKLEGERLALASTDALVVRTNFFGWSPTGRRSILEFFVNALESGEQVRGFTDFTTSSAYVQVLAEALWDLCERDVSGLVHLTSPDSMTKFAFGLAVAEEFCLDSALITPSRSAMQPPRDGDISLDVTKAQELLGRQLPSMRAGIAAARADGSHLRHALDSKRD